MPAPHVHSHTFTATRSQPNVHDKYLDLVSGFAQDYVDFQLFLAAEDSDFYGVSSAVFVHDLGEILLAFEAVSVDGDHQISADHDGSVAEVGAFGAATQAGAVGGATGDGLNDEETVVGCEAEFVGQFGIDGDGANAEGGTAHASQGDEIVDDGFSGIDGDGESDAGALADAGGDHRINADDFAVEVEERASRITGVDGGVGLNGVFDDHAVGLLHLADGTDDAAGEGSGEPEGIADGVDLLADLQIGGIAEGHGLQTGGLDLKDSQVMCLVGADDGGFVFLAVVKGDPDFTRVGDDVVVGKDVSFFVDDETGALAFLRIEAVKEIEGLNFRSDIDDGGDVLAVDADVVLLFGVEGFASGGFGDLNVLGVADPIGRMEESVTVGGEVEESGCQNNAEEKRARESHW